MLRALARQANHTPGTVLQDIGVYKINHVLGKWVHCQNPYAVPNVFNGHHHWTEGPFDWHRQHERMLQPGVSVFHMDFTLPWCVQNHLEKVFLTVSYFTGQGMPPCHAQILVNHKVLVHHDNIKNENHGITHTTRHIPFDWLHLHQSGKPNRITIRFTEGLGNIFLQSLKISAELPPPGHLGTPPISVTMVPQQQPATITIQPGGMQPQMGYPQPG
jgi:hypothetical protein